MLLQVRQTILSIIGAIVIFSGTNANAQTTQEIVELFDQIIGENTPGQAFQKHSYLAFNDNSDGTKYYVGGIGDIRISVSAKDGRIQYFNVQTDANLNPSLRPILEKHFGEFTERKNTTLTSASIKASASFSNVELDFFDTLGLIYLKGNVRISADFTGVVHTKAGVVYSEPYTSISANLQ